MIQNECNLLQIECDEVDMISKRSAIFTTKRGLMRISILLATIGVSVAAPASADVPPISELHLVCLGAGSANKFRTTNVYASDNYGNSAWGNAIASREQPFEDQVNIEIVAGEGRIRMPRTMLPPIHGGNGGWFTLKNLKITDNEITASAGVNFMNSPKVRLDRLTGILSMSGKAGDFSGECQPYDPATAKRKF